MNKKEPLISVVMPTFNAQKYISISIESILNQTFSNFEFIIIDDASTDNTLKIIEKYSKKDKRIKIIKNKNNLNIGGSLNKGIKHSRSNFIARMDADDIALSNRLKLQYELMQKDTNLAVVGGYISVINENGENLYIRKYPTENEKIKKAFFRYMPFAHPSVMIRKNFFNEVGGYDPKKSPSEDMDLWIKLGVKHSFGNIDRPVLKYRLIKDSSSNKDFRKVELNTVKMRINAITEYGYKPSLYDIFYNIAQISTLWVTPSWLRIKVFNIMRRLKFI